MAYSIRVHWQTSSGESRSFLGSSDNLGSYRDQVSSRGGSIIRIESLGVGRNVPRPEGSRVEGTKVVMEENEPSPVKEKQVEPVQAEVKPIPTEFTQQQWMQFQYEEMSRTQSERS